MRESSANRSLSDGAVLRTCHLGALEPLRDIYDIDECCAKLLPDRREPIPDGRRGCRLGRTSDNTFEPQLSKAIGEHLG